MRTLPLAVALVWIAGCAQSTDCDYVDQEPSGNIGQDLLGCWQTFGVGTLDVYQFNADSTYRYINPSGSLFAGGQITNASYVLTGDVLDLQNGLAPTQVNVTPTSLILVDPKIYMRRGVCRGFGFEHHESCTP